MGRSILNECVRTRLLSTRLFAVEHREYAQPGNAPIARDIVVHPGAVVVLPLLDDDRVVMIRNYRYTVEQELWELPAGTREDGETPIETARRELEEETGYRAASIKPLCEFYTSPGVSTERMFAFVATELTPVPQRLEAGERIRVEVVPMTRVRSMLRNGDLVDGKSIAVLARHLCERDGLLPRDASNEG